jgi:hypothetical protein
MGFRWHAESHRSGGSLGGEDLARRASVVYLPIFRIELSRKRQLCGGRLRTCFRDVSALNFERPARGFVAFGAFIVDGGFTDDFTETADAGRSPYPQLRSFDRDMLHPRGRPVRQTL